MLFGFLGLVIESYGAQHGWRWSQEFVEFSTFALYFYFLYDPPRVGKMQITRTMLLVCLAIAAVGELILTGYNKFYLYRVSLMPLFVPPGHVLIFLCGLSISQQRWFRMGPALMIAGMIIGVFLVQISHGKDFLSVGWLALFIPAMIWGKERALYATMFSFTLGVELVGTYLGVWHWQPKLYFYGYILNAANPPLTAGGGYAILDLLTVQGTLLIEQYRQRKQS